MMRLSCGCPFWARWKATNRLGTFLYVSGITSGGGSTRWGGIEGHEACHRLPRFDLHSRPYVLWIGRGTWRCWLKYHHRRGEEIGFGDYCGKDIPWPCCGSVRYAHADDCPEATR